MPTAFPVLYPIVKQLVQDDAVKLADFAEYDTAIASAISGRYSKDRPLVKAKEYTGDGAAYLFALPTATPPAVAWIDQFSTIVSVEYPIDQRPPVFLDAREVSVDFVTETTKKLILHDTTPENTVKLRLRYTTQRVAEADVLATDQDAVAKLAASVCCRMLAGIYAQTSDPTIAADVVNYRTKAQEYTALADKLEKAYRSQMGQDKEDTPPSSSGWVNWDTRLQSGYDYFQHPRARR